MAIKTLINLVSAVSSLKNEFLKKFCKVKYMSRQYNNFVKKLSNVHITVLTPEDEFISLKKTEKYPSLKMQCNNNHQFSMVITSIGNKLKKCVDSDTKFCANCGEKPVLVEKVKAAEICKTLGFEFVNFERRTVTYKCTCGNVSSTHINNLCRENRRATCPNCQYSDQRIAVSTVAKTFSDAGCELLSDYTGRNTPVKYRCSCGNISNIRFADFLRGKRCRKCYIERRKNK